MLSAYRNKYQSLTVEQLNEEVEAIDHRTEFLTLQLAKANISFHRQQLLKQELNQLAKRRRYALSVSHEKRYRAHQQSLPFGDMFDY